MEKVKKLFWILLVTAFITGMLTGCGTKQSEPQKYTYRFEVEIEGNTGLIFIQSTDQDLNIMFAQSGKYITIGEFASQDIRVKGYRKIGDLK